MLETVHTLQGTQSIVITKDFRMDHWSGIAIHKRATMTRFKKKLKRDNKKAVKKESCPFCQEQKKRPLIAYMRKMALEKQKSRICEEDENEDQHCHRYDDKECAKK